MLLFKINGRTPKKKPKLKKITIQGQRITVPNIFKIIFSVFVKTTILKF